MGNSLAAMQIGDDEPAGVSLSQVVLRKFGSIWVHQRHIQRIVVGSHRFSTSVLPGRAYVSPFSHGEVAEWSNAPDSKSGVPQGTGGSNPSLSATFTTICESDVKSGLLTYTKLIPELKSNVVPGRPKIMAWNSPSAIFPFTHEH